MVELYIDTERLDKMSHEWAKEHNPELEEAAAEAYKQGILLGLYSLQPYLSVVRYYFHKIKSYFKKK